MNRVTTLTLSAVLLPLLGLVLPSSEAAAQQAGPTLHRYLVRAVLSTEGLKNLQKQPPTALKAGVAKFVESVGGKLEFWFFDYGASTAYSVIGYPDEVAAATAQLSTNMAGYARVTIRPLLTAEEMDKAVEKNTSRSRPPTTTTITIGACPGTAEASACRRWASCEKHDYWLRLRPGERGPRTHALQAGAGEDWGK